MVWRIWISTVRGCYWSVTFITKGNKSVKSVRKRKQCTRHFLWTGVWFLPPTCTPCQLLLSCQTLFPNRKLSRQASLRKQPTFGGAITGLPAKWRLRNERINSILMTRHYPDLPRSGYCFWLVMPRGKFSFGRTISIRQLPFAVFSDNLFWHRCILVYNRMVLPEIPNGHAQWEIRNFKALHHRETTENWNKIDKNYT